MSVNAGELRETMELRLRLQKEGIARPPEQVCVATKALVNELRKIEPNERIDVVIESDMENNLLRYKYLYNGKVLSEVEGRPHDPGA